MPWLISYITLLKSNKKDLVEPQLTLSVWLTSRPLLLIHDTESQSQLLYEHKKREIFFSQWYVMEGCLGKYKNQDWYPGHKHVNEITFLKVCMKQMKKKWLSPSKLWKFHISLFLFMLTEDEHCPLTETRHLRILLLCFSMCRDKEEFCLGIQNQSKQCWHFISPGINNLGSNNGNKG